MEKYFIRCICGSNFSKNFSFGKIFYQMHLTKNQGWNLALIFDRWRLIKYFFPNRFWRGLKKNVFLISLLISKEIRALRLFFLRSIFQVWRFFIAQLVKNLQTILEKCWKNFFVPTLSKKFFLLEKNILSDAFVAFPGI